MHRELRRKGVTLQLLWLEYRQAHPDGYGYRAPRAWLGHRHPTWPRTSSRHVLISEKTALGSGPVSRGYLVWNLQRHGVSIERIRRDRVLHEALTARADPLRLVLVFGMSHTTAAGTRLSPAISSLTSRPRLAASELPRPTGRTLRT